MKLFPKLALAVSSLLAVTIVSLCLSFYWIQDRQIRQSADQQRRAVLENLAHIAEESFLSNDDLLLIKYTGLLAKWNTALVSASVVNPQGEVLAHSEPSRIGKPLADSETSTSQVSVLTQPVRLGTHWTGTASVAFSERLYQDQIHAQLLAARGRMIQIVLLSLLFGIAVSFVLALSWTRPIKRLVHSTEEIGKRDWRADTATPGSADRRDELGTLSRSFREMAVRLKELDAMKEDFVSAVTHELRSPLGAIESYLNLIRDEIKEGVPASTWVSYLDRIRINTQRLTRFVNDLLDVAALERGKVRLDMQPADLFRVVQDVISLFELKFQEKNMHCELHPVSSLPPVLMDAEKIRQVLINLVSNAFKFTPAGRRVELKIEALPSGQELRVSVSDTGIGIAKADREKIFNKFEQVHSARQIVKGPKGTGLGLSISRQLIQMHGGALTVDSHPGEGSTFSFTLPVTGANQTSREPAVSGTLKEIA